MVITPNQLQRNKELHDIEVSQDNVLGGMEVSQKNSMPFPDNRNPDSDFNNRFGNLPPNGILNDIKPRDPVPQLQRRLERRVSGDEDFKTMVKPIGMDLALPQTAETLLEDVAPKPTMMEKLFGLNGVERMKLWPERMLVDLNEAASKVSKGEVPMWAIDPATGEMHTSMEAMEKAWEMMPGANSATLLRGAIGKAAKTDAIKNEPNTFPQRIAESPDEMQYMIRQARRLNEETRADPQTNPSGVARGAPRQSHENPTDYALRVIGEALDLPVNTESTVRNGVLETRPAGRPRSVVEEYDFITEKTRSLGNEKLKEGNMFLNKVKGGYSESSVNHRFKFFDEKTGTLGDLKLSERNGGKRLYVEGIGLGNGIDPNSMGRAATNNILKALAKEFPKAETIAGFRVSGGRGKSGKTGPAEMPLERFRRKNKIDDLTED